MMSRLRLSNNKSDNEDVSGEEGEESRGRLKKGPWTLAEDIMLREYVMKYGEGNWNSVQKNSELARCGKSCRLRWANHLRPNLKKGAFSQAEEQIIVQLHAKLGNKWARMAAQLPGRTDNEIKNFWNTRSKRCQRAGLPLYPPEVLHEANLYRLQQQYLTQPNSSSSSSLSFSPFLSSPNPHKLNDLTYPSVNTNQNQPDSSYYSNSNPLYSQFKFLYEATSNGNMSLPLSSSSSLFNQSFVANNSHDYANNKNDFHYSNAAAIPSSPYEPLPLLQSSNTEASLLSQSPPSSTTPTSSNLSGIYGLTGGGASTTANHGYEVAPLSPQGKGYIVDALVAEAQSLCRNEYSKSEDSTASKELSRKRKGIAIERSSEKEDNLVLNSANKNDGKTNNRLQRDGLGSFRFSTGNAKIVGDGLEEINSMDDDLYGLLNNYQEMPVPDWYHKGGQSLGLKTQLDSSLDTANQEFATHGNFWGNLSDTF